jgi:uncharacterized low-complexity protein
MNNKISSMSALMGVAFAASALSPMASAADASFAANNLDSGYTLAENHATKTDGEHKCGEGKCSADHKKTDGEHKCGADKKAEGEGKCGEGKCGAEKKADAEGKCGEGKCGADKKAE